MQSHNDERMVGNLDALEERRVVFLVRFVDYQQKLAQRYNRKVRPWGFMHRNLILHKAIRSMKDHNARKLAPNWEGPYRVTTTAGAGAYYLEDMEERPFPQPWNVCNLKKYYPQVNDSEGKNSCKMYFNFVNKRRMNNSESMLLYIMLVIH